MGNGDCCIEHLDTMESGGGTVTTIGGQVVPTVFELKVPWWIVLRSVLLGPILIPIRYTL